MEALELVIVAIAALAGATVQSATGFGFALVASPVVFAVAEPAEAITILIVLSTFLNLLVVLEALGERRRSDIRRREAIRVLIWAVPGVVGGIFILFALAKPTLQVIVGVCVIVAVAVQARSKRNEARAATPVAEAVAGLAAGTLTTTTATSGPPLVLLLRSTGASPQEFRDTMAALFLALNIMGAVALAVNGEGDDLPKLGILVVLLGMVLLGRAAGRLVFDRFDPESFWLAGLAVIVASGLGSIVAGLSG